MKRLLSLVALFALYVVEIMASPGGRIARDLFDNPIGKVIAIVLAIIFFPIMIRSYIRRKKAYKNTRKKLALLSKIDFELFDEINLKNRMTDVFTRVHKAWSERDLDNCETYMTNWYRQNQQSVFLDEWDKKGMMNVCTIKELKSVKPIHLRLSQNDNFEGSRIMYAIDANMEDYLVNVEDTSIVEGKKEFNDVETVWTLKLEDNSWKVDNIEQSEMVLNYMKMDSKATDQIIENMLNLA